MDTATRIRSYLRTELALPEQEAGERTNDLLAILAELPGMASSLIKHWWLFLVRGILAVLFGVLTLVQPMAALIALVFVFGVWAFIDGINALALAFSGRRSWQLILIGLMGIAAGAITFFRPEITAVALYALFAGWSIARGIIEIALAIELRREIRGEVWLALGGVLSIAFGVLLILLPVAGVLAVAWLIGLYALLFGGAMIALSIRLHGLREPEAKRMPIHRQAPQPT